MVLGLSFNGLEEAWDLFAKLERKEMGSQSRQRWIGKDLREVKNLKWGLPYDKVDGEQSKGSKRKTRGAKGVSK